MKPKLFLITHEYLPIRSGGVTLICELTSKLAARGFEIVIMAPKLNHPAGGNEICHDPRVKVVRVQTFRRSTGNAALIELILFGVLGSFHAMYLAKKFKVDKIWSIFIIPSGLIGTVLKCLYKLPHFVYVGGADLPQVASKFSRVQKFFTLLVSIILNYATKIIAAEGLDHFVGQLTTNKEIVVVPSGADLKAIERLPPPPRESDKVTLITVGRLIERKGFLQVARSLAQLSSEDRVKIRWIIVGAGPLLEPLQKFIQENNIEECVTFVGEVQQGDVGKYLSKADIFVFYSSPEGTSLAMAEAMGHGLPILTSDVPGNREMFNGNGVLVPFENQSLLNDAIKNIICQANYFSDWSKLSIEQSKKYDWNNIVDVYQKIF